MTSENLVDDDGVRTDLAMQSSSDTDISTRRMANFKIEQQRPPIQAFQMFPPEVTMYSSAADKIRLFRAMFMGRQDVYARRWETTKTGKSGYSPACQMEWTRGVCDKKRTPCAICPSRQFIPLTDETVRAHLLGKDARQKDFVMGVYPLLPDDTVRFAAFDFDKKTWRSDSASVCETIHELGLPIARERSRSGNGAHIWFFFESPQPAVFVRDVLTYILSLTIERNPEIGLDSYDRIFPNQDRLPKGGFGNLIALPLQKKARAAGNSCFVDERLVPYPDQWKFLSDLPLVCEKQLRILRARVYAEHRALLPQREEEIARYEPWSLFSPGNVQNDESNAKDRIAGNVEIILANAVYVQQDALTPTVRGRLIRLASFVNPEYSEAQRMRRSVYGIPRVIDRSENGDEFLVLPRGCLEKARETIATAGGTCNTLDRRQGGSPFAVEFQGELRLEQKAAARELLKYDTGILAAGTAFGKTVLAAWIIAARKVNTLVLVNRRQLLDQWVVRLSEFLGVSKKEIGRFGGGTHEQTGRLDVALIQSLARLEVPFLINHLKSYGQIIVDECHAISAPSFEKVARVAPARYFLGLSATLVRKDGHHPIIEMMCGPVRYRVEAKQMSDYARFRHVVRIRTTPFVPKTGAVADEGQSAFASVMQEMMTNDARNELITRDVLESVAEGRSPVVLSERREHLDLLATRLQEKVRHLIVLRGGMGRKQAREVLTRLAAIPPTETRVLLATGSYLGEGFDDARLDTLFLALPISWKGRIVQYAGRLHRRCDGKREVRICDYLDTRVAFCMKMFNKRCRGYQAIGYDITIPDDTFAGWPKDVPVPIELRSCETYSDSVKRLCRDGVDEQTADLFVEAARRLEEETHRTVSPIYKHDADERLPESTPRSATEAFLFRYLENQPLTKNRFELNGKLEIPFGPNPYMEIDLLAREPKIAIEIDGKFHFADPENYRRDRRKDLLLQKAGYLVIRFLAEDVVERLNAIMDVIVDVLTKR